MFIRNKNIRNLNFEGWRRAGNKIIHELIYSELSRITATNLSQIARFHIQLYPLEQTLLCGS